MGQESSGRLRNLPEVIQPLSGLAGFEPRLSTYRQRGPDICPNSKVRITPSHGDPADHPRPPPPHTQVLNKNSCSFVCGEKSRVRGQGGVKATVADFELQVFCFVGCSQTCSINFNVNFFGGDSCRIPAKNFNNQTELDQTLSVHA